MGKIIAIIDKRGKNAKEKAIDMLEISKQKHAKAFGIASPTTVKIEKSIKALHSQELDSPVIVGQVFSETFTTDKPQPMKLDDAALVFDGRTYPTARVSDAEIIAKKLEKNCEEPIEKLVNKSEGCFAFAVAEPEKIIAARDAMGIHPLYFGENSRLAAVACERKALWRIGIRTVNSFPPGNIASIDRNGFTLKPIKTLVFLKAKQITMQTAARRLEKLLQRSVKQRVSGISKVAVAFSGGLDSSIIAFLAKNMGTEVHLVHVSLRNQPETEQAKRAAEHLKLPIHVRLYDARDVEKTLSEVLWLIEEPDPIKASIGIPIYWAAEKAAETDFKVMLAGQGADELFGGYQRYIRDYLSYGGEKLRRTFFDDVLKLSENNFERDFKICNFHDVELRLPFAMYEMAKFALRLPIELKIEMRNSGLRKLVLRRVAEDLGLPRSITSKPKKAVQYATGVNETLRKTAKAKGMPVKQYVQKTFQTVFKKMVRIE
jgi:asparagine synthase (glutamine-hydrolysing)